MITFFKRDNRFNIAPQGNVKEKWYKYYYQIKLLPSINLYIDKSGLDIKENKSGTYMLTYIISLSWLTYNIGLTLSKPKSFQLQENESFR